MNDNRQVAQVPYIVHEAAMARQEETTMRLLVAVIVLAIALIADRRK